MNTIIAVPFDQTLAEFIGKKGSVNSITFYNRKINEDVIVALQPSSIEEKFYALPQSLLMADKIVVSTKSIDKLFGEVLVACSLLNKKVIFTKDNDISKILSTIAIRKFAFSEEQEMLGLILSREEAKESDKTRIDIDKAFNVKGIGTVALGVVTKGKVKVHDTLYNKSGKIVTIRSIQSQDQDIKEAEIGTRVGIALKGIDETELGKGDLLASNQINSSKMVELKVNISNFAKESIEKGKFYFIAIGFSYVSAKVEEIQGSNLKLSLEKEIPVEKGDAFMLVRTIAPRIFASGEVEAVT